MTLNVYTDASYCDNYRIAACGYVFFLDRKMMRHEVVILGNVSCIQQAEMLAIKFAVEKSVEMFGYVHHLNIYTDFQNAIDCFNNNEAEIAAISKVLYEQNLQGILTEIEDNDCHVQLHKVKSHANLDDRDNHTFENRRIDLSVRRALRKQRKQMINNT